MSKLKVIVLTVPDTFQAEWWLVVVRTALREIAARESVYADEMADSARLVDLEAIRKPGGPHGMSYTDGWNAALERVAREE